MLFSQVPRTALIPLRIASRLKMVKSENIQLRQYTANVFVVNYTTFRSVPFPGQFLSYFLLLIVVYYKSSYSYSSTTKLSYFLLLIIVYYELSYFTLVRQDCRTFYYELSYSKLDYIFCTTNMQYFCCSPAVTEYDK